MSLPKQILISEAENVSPDPAPNVVLTEKEKAGVKFTWTIIIIMIALIIILLAVFIFIENHIFNAITDISDVKNQYQLDNVVGILSKIEQLQQNFRAFWLDVLRLILLNVLFPTLTAILGYVFGTNQK